MYTVFLSIMIICLLNRYPVKIPPSIQLDFAGRLINTYQIIAHFMVFLKFMGCPYNIFGADDDQPEFEFFAMNVCDYVGWIAIFSRLRKVGLLEKTLANTHMATGMISLLGHKSFQEIYIKNNVYVWNLFRGVFVLTDSLVRGYFHFVVLKNFRIVSASRDF